MFHYDAFISYNHNPRDNRITRALQQKLESFRLPKDVVTSSGKDKIERVFLDKGELEVAGDLNEIIQNALENSDYLIVICSPEGKASIWVKREIEFFLKNHSIDRILTVITDGEPFDVLPEAILYEDVDDGSGNMIRKSREPLSCDYRMPLRKAEREELPRLIAAILGCRYDELVQRQKQYRMRRQMALLAAAAVLFTSATAYLIWSNHKIQANYDRSLREESINLATQSEDALARGDRLGAIGYALDALPSKGKDRPVVSDAILALSEALDIYHSTQYRRWTAVRQFSADVSCYEAVPFTIDEKEYIAARLAGGSMRIWDAGSGEELMTDYTQALAESGEEAAQLHVTDDKTLLMMSNKKLFAIDVPAEKEKFSLDLSIPSDAEAEVSRYSEFCCNDDQLWVVVYGPEEQRLLQIDLKAGNAVKDFSTGDYYPEKLALSPDGKYLAFVHEINDFDADRLELVNTENGERETLDRPFITDIHFDERGRLIICGINDKSPGETDYSTVNSSDYISYGRDLTYDFTEYAERSQFITCLEAPSLSEAWSTEYSGTFCGKPKLRFHPASEDRSGRYKGAFACYTGSDVRIVGSDGRLIDDLDFHDPVIYCSFTDKLVHAILLDGRMGVYNTEKKRLTISTNVFAGTIRDVFTDPDSGSGSFYMTSDDSSADGKRRLTQYMVRGMDPEWKEFANDITHSTASALRTTVSYEDCFYEIWREEDHLLLDDENVARIIGRNAETGDIVLDKTIPMPKEADEYSNFYYAGFDESAGRLYFADVISSPDLVEFDLQTGAHRFIGLSPDSSIQCDDPEEALNADYLDNSGPLAQDMDGGVMYCAAVIDESYDDPVTHEWIDASSLTLVTMDRDTETFSFASLTDIDPESGISYIAADISAEKKLLVSADSSNVISSFNFNGKRNWSSDPLPSEPLTLDLTDDGHVLVITESEPAVFELHVLSVSDGREEAVTPLGRVKNVSDDPGFWSSAFIPLSPEEALLRWDYKDNAFVLNTADWSLRGKISSFLTYNASAGSFIIGDLDTITGDNTMGSVPYRTLDELIAEGRAVIEE